MAPIPTAASNAPTMLKRQQHGLFVLLFIHINIPSFIIYHMKQLAKWCRYVIMIKMKIYVLGGTNA